MPNVKAQVKGAEAEENGKTEAQGQKDAHGGGTQRGPEAELLRCLHIHTSLVEGQGSAGVAESVDETEGIILIGGESGVIGESGREGERE